jgi:acetyl esterase/lipase
MYLLRILVLTVMWTPAVASSDDVGRSLSGLERFKAADRNGDGRIARAEAPEYFMLDGFDTDGDGFITLTEAIAFARYARKASREEALLGARYSKAQNIAYVDAPADVHRQSLDIYGPSEPAATGRPVLVFIHGGGWSMGDKAGSLAQKVPWLAKQGWMTVSINYRLSPAVQHPAHIDDVAAAVAWVHDHISAYGGDPDRIVVMGHSAGAHLAALVAADPRRLAAHGKPLSTIKAAILLDGAAYDLPSLLGSKWLPASARKMHEQWVGVDPVKWMDASPAHTIEVGSELPEFLILHTARPGGKRQSELLGKRLRAAGGKAVVVECKDDSHSSINRDIGRKGHLATAGVAGVLGRIGR